MDNLLNKLAHLHLQSGIESEIRKLRFELKQTMKMYDSACKEAAVAKQEVRFLYTYQMIFLFSEVLNSTLFQPCSS